ncbi:WD40 repeat-containing protein [Tieghemostelium lacteum]|uniref:Coatomer subunit beta' n=1 Tax=Tieghemostelium lacteum TaxID=361077 RepID=A0A151Z4A3_TIELA|nr:WD40 repeat-containing protein [Tieghemostelium lacteum]|eukprot:KYQ88624.1 WD40 repeat-containing protein [Tieghemostelium lacteum]
MPLRLDVKKKLSTRSDRVKSVDIHPTEPWILASLFNGNVFIWNYETQNMVKSFEVSPETPVRAAKFVARKQWVIAGSDDTFIRVYNYNTMEKIKSFEAHADYIRCLVVHPTLPLLLSSSDDMSIKLWDWEKGWNCVQVFEGHSHYVMSIALNPKDTNIFATASLDKTIKVWSMNSPNPHFTLEGHEKGVNTVEYFSGGEKPYLISGADDKLVKIWDYQNKNCVQTLDGHSNNVSVVCYHPELPLILSGSEDGTVKLWHSSTYRLEKTLNYGMGHVWAMNFLRGSNFIGLGYDDGTVVLKIGKNKPPVSMDQGGKVILARHNEIRIANLQSTFEREIQDGEKLTGIATKDLGNCEVFPQRLQHNNNGTFVTVCGDGEFIIYTARAWRNKAFGSALEFVWSAVGSSQYAVRENTSRVKVFNNFTEQRNFKPNFSAEGIFGGHLLAVRSNSFVYFYSWDNCDIIRKIEIAPKNIFWSENGEFFAIATEATTYILRYNKDSVEKYLESGQPIEEDGIEDAFEVVHQFEERIGSACWVGDCFIYVNRQSKLNYCVGTEIVTISHLDKHMYLLGYLPETGRLYLADKNLNIVTYTLHVSVINYQTSVLRGDMDSAEKILPKIPQDQRNSIAHFLESQGHKELALEVSLDLDHKFELAIQLENLQVAHEIALKSDSESKYKHLGDLALNRGEISLAESCLKKAEDLPGLLLLYTSTGNAKGLQELATLSQQKAQTNITFICNLLLPNGTNQCLEILSQSGDNAEATFMARTYAPSQVPQMLSKWKENLKLISSKAAQALADPIDYPNLFPSYEQSLKAEAYFSNESKRTLPAKEYQNISRNRNLLEEIQNVSQDEINRLTTNLKQTSLVDLGNDSSTDNTSNNHQNGIDKQSHQQQTSPTTTTTTTTTTTNTNNNNNSSSTTVLPTNIDSPPIFTSPTNTIQSPPKNTTSLIDEDIVLIPTSTSPLSNPSVVSTQQEAKTDDQDDYPLDGEDEAF